MKKSILECERPLHYKVRVKYKYTVAFDISCNTKIVPAAPIKEGLIRLDATGRLTVCKGYAWDGATACPDIPTILRGSLFHDALYQLMRDGHLPLSERDKADRLLEQVCIDAGMSVWLARLVYLAVKHCAKKAALPDIKETP